MTDCDLIKSTLRSLGEIGRNRFVVGGIPSRAFAIRLSASVYSFAECGNADDEKLWRPIIQCLRDPCRIKLGQLKRALRSGHWSRPAPANSRGVRSREGFWVAAE